VQFSWWASETTKKLHITWRLSRTAKEIARLLGGLAEWPRKLQNCNFTWRLSRAAKKIDRLLGSVAELPRKLHIFLVVFVEPPSNIYIYILAVPIQPPRQTQFGVVIAIQSYI